MDETGMPDRACIVGAGPAGLAAARACRRHGIDADVFERHHDVGGLWDPDNHGTPIYHSAHFISSKTLSHFAGFPMPDDYPDYPSHRQILDYAHAFADAYGLRPMIRFNTEVARARPEDGGWMVALKGGETGRYRWLVCANGTNWHPNIPDIPGKFTGEIRHSVTYRHMDEFRGKRVLVVGAGNSGCDIACDAAKAADAAFISMRRGYHFIPKRVFGKPADVFAEEGPHLPMWLAQPVFGALLRVLNGDLRKLGLPAPDHKVFESHPILNDQILHHLSHGDIEAKGDITRFDGREAVFADGSRETVDLVILATGYRWDIPYLDPAEISWKGGRPHLFLNVFAREHETLFATSFVETNGGAYKLFDTMADMAARAMLAQRDEPALAAKLRRIVTAERPDLSGGVRYVGSDRHATYTNVDAFRKAVKRFRRRMGWPEVRGEDFEPLRAGSADRAAA